MKIRIRKKSLPRKFDRLKGANRAVLIGEVRVSRGDRICMKLLVFKSMKDLHYFWRHGLKKDALRRGVGAVSTLIEFKKWLYDNGSESKEWMEVDRRYFAVMGLTMNALNMEIVCHEAVHAGFAYSYRSRAQWPNPKLKEEESVCWPAGRIACGVNRLLHKSRLYKKAG